METLIGYIVVMGGVLTFATFYKPQKRNPASQTKDVGTSTEPSGGSSHG